jgi:hypothetical protein
MTNIPTVKECVNNNQQVEFVRYKANELWYKCENGLEFPVPVSDIGDATFLAKDKALLFMRYIRKQIEALEIAAR